ncbi:MAG: glycosyltransferase [Chloroflexi bacterium]|nr:glycosyltransferase [Chloroflexota bacterium]
MANAGDLPFISVIVPFRNEVRHVTACAESLLNQHYPAQHHELIFVDNGSNDGSAHALLSQQRITLLYEPRQSPYVARNLGLRTAQGQLIAFTDADCIAATDWLQQISAGMADPALQILLGSNAYGQRSLLLDMLSAYEAAKKNYIFAGHHGPAYHGQCNNMVVRRPLLEELGGFAERQRGADTILVHQCVAKYGPQAIAYRPAMRVQHLEVDSIGTYYRKCAIYRRSRHAYRHLAPVRGLTGHERYLVFRNTVHSGGYSLPQALLLFALLASGLVFCTIRSHWPVLDR